MIGDPRPRDNDDSAVDRRWRERANREPEEAQVAEVLREFESAVVAPDGTAYRASACGGEARDGTRRWHGWIEFEDNSGGRTIRTPRETTQRNRTDTAYWASGLTLHYLEGALRRALDPNVIRIRKPRHAAPAFEAPAPDFTSSAGASSAKVQRIRRGTSLAAAIAKPRREVKCVAPPPVPTRSTLDFTSIGGMHGLKEQVRRIVDTIHLHRDDARSYGIVRNGILLYGPPGCGKTFFAQATAGEFALRFLRVPLESTVSKYVGGAPEAIERVFREARARTPCLLLFDEFDAIACRRDEVLTVHEQQMVNALLQQLDVHRDVPGLLIVAATNRFEDLDPAVIREGRFDYKVRIPEPDFDARREILRVLLGNRPHAPGLNTARLARDLEGFTAARIQNLVNEAALLALESGVPIAQRHFRAAYRAQVSVGRYRGTRLGWDDLILSAKTKRKLQSIQKFIENPQLVRRLGIAAPSGILLFGPPGTGKTTIARVLASETEASFFAANAAEIFSKWLGESERQVKDLFARARERVPAIVFIDEIDAVAERRGEAQSAADHARNAVVNTFLAEMDGLDSSTRIFVIGATNRAGLLDEALLRPGRLGEAIEIALPDATDRLALLKLLSKQMHLDPSVVLGDLAAGTEGASGADLKGLCTLAGQHAFVRELESAGAAAAVTGSDFNHALEEVRSRQIWTRREHPIGFGLESAEAR
jgi:transitional endoplasmic reticulum ATPase